MTQLGEAGGIWWWTKARIALFHRVDARHIPEQWILFPDSILLPKAKHNAALWILAHMVFYTVKGDPPLMMMDCTY
jgi:hypothetical protein